MPSLRDDDDSTAIDMDLHEEQPAASKLKKVAIVGTPIAAILIVFLLWPSSGESDLGPAAIRPQAAVKGLDQNNMDLSVAPQEDFNLYANGKWLQDNKIPDEYSKWGTFYQLRDDTLITQHRIMEKAAGLVQDPEATKQWKQVGAFWKSAMNMATIDAEDLKPLAELRATVKAVQDSSSYSALLGYLHASGFDTLFEIMPSENPENSGSVILWIDQGGLGMPDREYYFDETHAAVKTKYHQYIKEMLAVCGYSSADAATAADSILALETKLATAAEKQEVRRDPNHLTNLHSLKQLKALSGDSFDWDQYATALGVDLKKGMINLPNPGFIKTVGEMLTDSSVLEDLKLYHEFHMVHALASSLPNKYLDTLFKYHQALTGQKTLSPRWKRMISLAERQIGELVGQLYCDEMFPASSKARAAEIVYEVRDELKKMLSVLEWMGDATKRKALQKVDKIKIKIGFPDEWIDYSALIVDADAALVTNVLTGMKFNTRRILNRLWKAPDPNLWYMTPQTVNAYYNPPGNEIVFPAAILQPPMFDPSFDDAVNFGAMGAVIGHELTHGFDDQGRKYDADGNVKEWWTPEDASKFRTRADKIVKQFAEYTVVGKNVNGELTQGENIADLGGLKIAYRAMQRTLKSNYTIDGLTQDQRFFLSWAQVWRQNSRKAAVEQQLATDPHSPAEWRIKGPLSNMPEFYNAFDVQEGQAMWRKPEERVSVW